ncbi:MerR family transcriptional regulator [Mycobacterium sp. ITM-2016-00317]|uniref:DNA polymerase III subunit beta family protein n=1 Tax=Mycobacterium sp. ITM-2016-00317 TaxID=2099694 RepID=UPI00287FC84C|nr:MerR family transcriptional regulator [Mycobacterium sp. ITM-2016-00317]WNG89832.1 MerR family transcriptional regulator [Mycobacterium sp. ITM-2016-00317]
MAHSKLMPIGSFARQSGLTASALRFYADSGLLLPAEVDPATGYRFYRAAQLERAVLLRGLREIGLPLAAVQSALDADREEAMRLIDEHVHTVITDAFAVQQQAAAIRASLPASPPLQVGTVRGPMVAAAIDQVLAATSCEPGLTALNGVRLEADCGAITLTATDRYRLCTRSLMSVEEATTAWTATVHADDLRAAVAALRRAPLVNIEGTDHGVWFRADDRGDRHCRLLSEPFPDYRQMVDALGAVSTRLAVSKPRLLQALEEHPADHVLLDVTTDGLAVHGRRTTGARVEGEPIRIWFEMTTLYPAVSTAIGADVLVDLRAVDQPATIRSADHGDLTTYAMPIAAPGAR